jgi:ketol-acid reductoisomerase
MYRGGLNYMRYSVSDTAEWGDYASGARVVDERTRAEMKRILGEIQSGAFARAWIAENEAGRPRFEEARRSEREQPIERVGARLRGMMPFLDPVTIKPGD